MGNWPREIVITATSGLLRIAGGVFAKKLRQIVRASAMVRSFSRRLFWQMRLAIYCAGTGGTRSAAISEGE
jgi:hypothetical protein